MLGIRVIPCLLYNNSGLVKSVRFKDATYIGDPINAVKIFNDKEVDELIFLDITASRESRPPDFEYIKNIASECFMPLCYGGGIKTLDDIQQILKIGVEKVSINTTAVKNPGFIKQASANFGSSTIVVSIDYKKNLLGKPQIVYNGAKDKGNTDPVTFAKIMEDNGAGEILINSVDRDGTMKGYDIELIKKITAHVNIPVIACGGAGSIDDLSKVVKEGGVSAVAAGSLFVFQGKYRAVLINFPERSELDLKLQHDGRRI